MPPSFSLFPPPPPSSLFSLPIILSVSKCLSIFVMGVDKSHDPDEMSSKRYEVQSYFLVGAKLLTRPVSRFPLKKINRLSRCSCRGVFFSCPRPQASRRRHNIAFIRSRPPGKLIENRYQNPTISYFPQISSHDGLKPSPHTWDRTRPLKKKTLGPFEYVCMYSTLYHPKLFSAGSFDFFLFCYFLIFFFTKLFSFPAKPCSFCRMAPQAGQLNYLRSLVPIFVRSSILFLWWLQVTVTLDKP